MTSSVHYTVRSRTDEERKIRNQNGPMFIDVDTVDPLYSKPVIDGEVDTTEPTTLHVVSGHFEGTPLDFKFYLPPKDLFKNRFFQYAYPLQPSDALHPDILFGASSGGYTVQCKGTIGYRHEAATAQFSRQVASKYYGVAPDEIFGYIYGGSGGSYVSIAGLENSDGIWQGAVPFVVACTRSIPDSQSIAAFGTLVLNDKLESLRDAVSPGGSGDPYADLSEMESAVLREVTKLGVPLRGWECFDYDAENAKRLLLFYPYIRDMDPTYADDFWNKEGYLGTEQSDLGDFFRAHRYVKTVKIDSVEADEEGNAVSLSVPSVPSGQNLRGVDATLVKEDGTLIATVKGSLDSQTKLFTLEKPPVQAPIKVPADSYLHYDNSWFLASHAYHRYFLPSRSGYPMWDQYRNEDGSAKYPQRPLEMGPIMSTSTSGGGVHTGDLNAKVIIVENVLDVDAYPWYGDWYTAQVKAAKGPNYEDSFRIWYNDNAHHYNGAVKSDQLGKFIQYDGIYYQALRDVANWAENDVPPPPSTNYKVDDGQIVLPPLAADRGGVQPVVRSLVNGKDRVDISAGETVTLAAEVEVPGVGFVVSAEWDFEGGGEYSQQETIAEPAPKLTFSATHTYDTPGTYFPVLRVASQREPVGKEALALAFNLGRTRVVVK